MFISHNRVNKVINYIFTSFFLSPSPLFIWRHPSSLIFHLTRSLASSSHTEVISTSFSNASHDHFSAFFFLAFSLNNIYISKIVLSVTFIKFYIMVFIVTIKIWITHYTVIKGIKNC